MLDTTVLIQIIEKVGIKFIHEIRGIFSILVYDTQKKIIYAFRDNWANSLYYFYKENKFFICSEINTIYKSLDISPEINEKEVQNSFRLNKIGYKTIYQNILKKSPGEMIELNIKTNSFNKIFNPKIEKNCLSPFDYVENSVKKIYKIMEKLFWI